MTSIISIQEFQDIILPLIGLNVSLAWKGYGSVIFIELGNLSPSNLGEYYNKKGEACINLNYYWRIENNNKIICGSSDSQHYIKTQIKSLEGNSIETVELNGNIPELFIRLSNGMIIQTMQLSSEDPEWAIKYEEGKYLSFENGSLMKSEGEGITLEQSPEDKWEYNKTKIIADRWTIPTLEHKSGDCIDCIDFIHLDGDGYLVDFGVCTKENGHFDGKVVNYTNSCPHFSKKAYGS